MFDFVTMLNDQAERLVVELMNAKRKAKESRGSDAAYHRGRAEELERWYNSVEEMLEKATEQRAKGRGRK